MSGGAAHRAQPQLVLRGFRWPVRCMLYGALTVALLHRAADLLAEAARLHQLVSRDPADSLPQCTAQPVRESHNHVRRTTHLVLRLRSAKAISHGSNAGM